MTEKRQTSQGYIIRILQHFATKLIWNITNFEMLFQAVVIFLSRLIYEINILVVRQLFRLLGIINRHELRLVYI
jgi:hypothetical protein